MAINKSFIEDVKKGVMNSNSDKQELSAGSTPRRYEPVEGTQKLNNRIHKESRYVDSHKNLPFSFRKPPKPIGRNACLQCDNCGAFHSGTTATVGVICETCSKFSTVTEVTFDW